ncbi:TPA: hypothetical protein DDW69_03300 [candidate division CPR2 bacterium]|uniref:Uncharacterized protein n=1 Tax=candidate division CPR2 bacterium GW2011_GWC1_41_48 TaxID=1618344 RepID=A0A0G0W7X8_UNCC2|nr:MAG: hypothetical protein UT47_C0003G0145 [candidate division CPR2 bacterium GW2011_GWC2_39_35]KKR28368.1 MAG: hypothetical protein UT60_C0022G0024 [candidate division CPR2 bacterium GW2011_GWD2_39_7]KKR29130.1 MAG: hypothetical protein UT59_C0012G0007 [candidate division CPR2 bacterium GW2011_GWD1_39_7]KKS09084.1 MAG: hypothetical protein UU65_C0003G0139 [candidate division CPR2 bacterium GW2011_GWC1_41_48]OGB62145.1 MAG: hypothetical protein A2Y27_00600 [candidate division CPR2 bacterium G
MNRYYLFEKLLKENGPFIIDAIDRKADPQVSLAFDKATFSDRTEALRIKQLVFLRPYKDANEPVTPVVFTYYINSRGELVINGSEIQKMVLERLSSDDVPNAVPHVIWDLNYPWNYIYNFDDVEKPNPTLHDSKYIASSMGADFHIRPNDGNAKLYDLWKYVLNQETGKLPN